uniref:Innexin n=1 Tax=Panagrolaimus sp. JU765 TaxID=591449 RepID=A0AC34PXX7_9BILA
MPYILLLSAFVAYIPKKVFNLFYKSSNYRETDIIESAWKKLKSAVVGETKADMPISSAIAEKLLLLRQTNTKMPITNYLTFIYFSMKILTICVNFVQLWILAISLRTSNIFWGWKLTRELFNGEDWRVNGFFPRVTFCDFQTRHLGQVRPHTVQCVLILNMFNEKIFLFLWFWFVFLILATFINLAWWFYRVFVTRRSIRMITDALQQTGLKDVDHDDVLEFIRRYLFYDGIVVLRLIDSNVGFISMANFKPF